MATIDQNQNTISRGSNGKRGLKKSLLCSRLENHILTKSNADPDFASTVVVSVPFTVSGGEHSHEIDGVLALQFLDDECVELIRTDENVVMRADVIIGFYV